MRIASITMVGQFPDGIDLHVRNLRWALTEEDHIFVVTLPSIIEQLKLKNEDRVTYVPFKPKEEISATGFINFWREFPGIVKQYDINPEWFLFMEEDIWFFARPILQDDPKLIRSFLPLGAYRNIMVNAERFHGRVWEGAQIVHGDIVRNAIEYGIDFSFVRETFLDKNRAKYEEEVGGPITMSMYQNPDTFDEFGLYCALIEKTRIEHHMVKASHLRGPESLHRLYPEIYRTATANQLEVIKKKMPYLDVLLAVAVFYTAGLWDKIDHLDWTKAQGESKREIDRLLITGHEWMTFQEYTRLDSLRLIMQGFIPRCESTKSAK